MQPWQGWALERVVLLLAAIMYMGVWLQLTLFHWRARFRLTAMLWPVLLTPLTILFALAAIASRDGFAGRAALVLLSLSLLLGMVGLVLHLRGVHRRFGGITWGNLAEGPPPALPMAYTLIAVLGLIGLLWQAGL